ncbi:ribonuclease BN [Streptomyces tateyamensis]|uniref:Ribonuclease BN n=1 Tax=Streptomyces tateyamensis TaxID=565073 RepID=A0A2V4NH29_9ACTN|nr:YhjD/YihY/BrkB family envelope integrity protein [Streptomyces tateyamensis]PYC81326.1 ribonuclease BN [Streptomyces tateyamensis]
MGRWSRARERGQELRERAEQLPGQVPLLARALAQLLRVNVLDNATRLAAQAFLTALPALLVLSVVAPAAVREGMVRSLHHQLGLSGEAQQQVQQLLASHQGEEANSFGVVGALVTLLSATALARALQRVCERAWELPKGKATVAAWRWLVWLGVWLGYLVLAGTIRGGFGLGWWLGVPLTFLVSTLLWWWTQHLLLGGRLAWAPLLPGALLAGVAMTGLGTAGQVYLPRAVARSIAQFGPLGVVFTLLSWLIAGFAVLTFALVLGRVVAEEPTVARLLGPPPAGPTKPGLSPDG